MILKAQLPTPSQRVIDQVVAILQRGGVIAFPTDTGYALGCDLFNKKSIDRIYRMKGRDPRTPLSFICADLTSLAQYAVVSNRAYKVMRKLLPGPYTFVMPATRLVPKLLISRNSTVGIRVPDHALPQALVKSLLHPIIGASCSSPEGKAFEKPEEIEKYFGKHIDCIVSFGTVASEPSTVVDFTSPEPTVIRKGKGDIKPLGIED